MKTTIETLEEEINFSKTQLLYNEFGTIVLCSGKYQNNKVFTGTVVSLSKSDLGHYGNGSVRDSFLQRDFKIFRGRLTLEND